MYNVVNTLAPSFLLIFFIFAGNKDNHTQTSSKFVQIVLTAELAALERLETSPETYNGENIVNTLAPSFLIGSSSFLQAIRITIRVRMSSTFSQM